MAYLRWKNCVKCGKKFQAVNHQEICPDCREKEERKEYLSYMIDIREGKTLEERVRQIEDWIYENRDIGYSTEIWRKEKRT